MFLKNKIKRNTVDILPLFDGKFDFAKIDTDLQKLLRDIMAILTLRKESLIYNLDVGGSLLNFVFDNITQDTFNELKTEIIHNLEASLYIKISSVSISQNKDDPKAIDINISIVVDDTTNFDIVFLLNKDGVMSVQTASKVISKIIIQ